MNFNDFKITQKLGIGFGALIAISVLLGGLAIYDMSAVTQDAAQLSEEYVPEVKVANNIERNVLKSMYELRAYGFTEEERYYTRSIENIQKVKQFLSEANELSQKYSELETLKAGVNTANEIMEKWQISITKTKELIDALSRNRAAMESSEQTYMDLCYAYLSVQENIISSGKNNATAGKKSVLVNSLIDKGNHIIIATWKAQVLRDPKVIESVLSKFTEINEIYPQLRRLTTDDLGLQQIDNNKTAADAYKEAMLNLVSNWKALQETNMQRMEIANQMQEQAQIVADAGITHTVKIANSAYKSLSGSSYVMIFGLLIAIIVGFSFALYISKLITAPILKGVTFAKQLSEGDLTATVDVNQKDEIGELAVALRFMTNKMKEVLTFVHVTTVNISTASTEMSASAQQVSQGANELASSTEEISSSIEQMSANIQQNTENAQQSASIANQLSENVGKVNQASKESVESIREIAGKITIISEIAFQTNILALNAAVEAARAGEHGKGFAVVAAEVRKLAERSRSAATEIEKLSKTSVAVSEQASQLMSQIIPEIQKTVRLVQEITAASIEQNTGTQQISNAIQQLNQVTQQNAAAAEEMATSSEELASQSEQLLETISFFKTGENLTTSTNRYTTHRNIKVAHLKQNRRPKKGINYDLSHNEENDGDFEKF